MLILFDHVTPKGIARSLSGHTVTKAKDQGWDTLSNDELLATAGQAIVTADKYSADRTDGGLKRKRR